MSTVDWAATCSCGCPATKHYADDGHFSCMQHMELGDHEPPRKPQKPKGAMSRKSWVEKTAVVLGQARQSPYRETDVAFVLKLAIAECARRCATHHSVEGIAQRCERDILALLEPGDEGEGG